MFQNQSFFETNANEPSSWEVGRDPKDGETQTDEKGDESVECQTQVSCFGRTQAEERGVQTAREPEPFDGLVKKGESWITMEEAIEQREKEHKAREKAREKERGDGHREDGDDMEESMMEEIGEDLMDPKMVDFFDAVGPMMLSQLEANARTQAYQEYDVDWDNSSQNVTSLCSLNPPFLQDEANSALQVTSLSWNASGALLAVAYGRVDVEGWCTNRGFVALWNVRGEGMEGSKPEYILESESCMQSVKFHPEEPLLLAGGTYTGDVMIWNLANERSKLVFQSEPALTNDDFPTHSSPITNICWALARRTLTSTRRIALVTSCANGKMITWGAGRPTTDERTGDTKLPYKPVHFYEVRNGSGVIMGITGFDVLQETSGGLGGSRHPIASLEDPAVVGTESGNIYRCKFKEVSYSREGPNNADPRRAHDPSQGGVGAMSGPVQGVHFSPFKRNKFLSCSSDGTIRVYEDFNRTPKVQIIPGSGVDAYIYDAKWSPSNPDLLACVSRDSHLYLFDVQKSVVQPVFSAVAAKKAAMSVAFNPSQTQYLATGDSSGTVQIWDLGMYS